MTWMSITISVVVASSALVATVNLIVELRRIGYEYKLKKAELDLEFEKFKDQLHLREYDRQKASEARKHELAALQVDLATAVENRRYRKTDSLKKRASAES